MWSERGRGGGTQLLGGRQPRVGQRDDWGSYVVHCMQVATLGDRALSVTLCVPESFAVTVRQKKKWSTTEKSASCRACACRGDLAGRRT